MSSFQSTMWTLIGGARDGNEEALREFVELYRPPILSFLSRRGFARESEDLSQEVFMRVFEKELLTGIAPSKGRFRSLLLTITKHVIGNHLERTRAKKRGSGKVSPLGDIDPADPKSDDEFDQVWFHHLIQTAFGRLALENPAYHRCLHLYVIEDKSYDEIGEIMGVPTTTVVNQIHRGRKKAQALIKAEIRQYSSSRGEFNEELQRIARFFPT